VVADAQPVETPAPVAAAPAPAPVEPPAARVEPIPAPAPAPAPVDSRAMLQDSGLVMIETTSKPAAPVVDEEPVKLGRPRRERPKAADESLQQVETKN